MEKSKAGSRPDSLGKKIFNTASPQRKTPLVPGVRGVSSAQGRPSRRQISRARGVKAGMFWKTRPQSRQDCIDSVNNICYLWKSLYSRLGWIPAVGFIVPADIVVIDLANLHPRVNADGLHAEDFQRPVAREAHVPKPGSDVDKQPQPPHRGAPLQHGHKVLCTGELLGAAQVEPVRLEHQPLLWDGELLHGVFHLHIQQAVLIDQQLVVKGQVIAVGV